MRRLSLLLVLALVPALGVPATAGAGKPKRRTRTVTVGDDYFAPTKLTVGRNTTVAFRWPLDNADTHDVRLRQAPRHVRHFRSQAATAGYTYRWRLTSGTKRGTYRFFCSFHANAMRMSIVVR